VTKIERLNRGPGFFCFKNIQPWPKVILPLQGKKETHLSAQSIKIIWINVFRFIQKERSPSIIKIPPIHMRCS